MYQPARAGSVFLITMVVVTTSLVIAYGFIDSMEREASASRSGHANALARQAASEGLTHAVVALRSAYLAEPGVPTHLRGSWRSSFDAIDSTKAGWLTGDEGDDFPGGREFTPEDSNENDVKSENLLTELYLFDNQWGVFDKRGDLYRQGWLNTTGIGRWIEPGHYHSDFIAQPVSFHLQHPVAANPASSDPAVITGEAYTPDVQRAFYYDANFLPVNSRALARYRLRYAVAVEDLTGHLLCSLPAAYTPGATSVSSAPAVISTPVESDVATGFAYGSAFANMCDMTWDNKTDEGIPGWWGWQALQGHVPVATKRAGEHGIEAGVVAEIGTSAMRLTDTDGTSVLGNHGERRFGAGSVYPNQRVQQALRGPVASFDSMFKHAPGSPMARAYMFTPFGRAGGSVAGRWDESKTDQPCPWRINLPTATSKTMAAMWFAYAPRELHTLRFNWNPADKLVLDERLPYTEYFQANLFDANRNPSFPGPVSVYPGSDPSVSDATWNPSLGADLNLNHIAFDCVPGLDGEDPDRSALSGVRSGLPGQSTMTLDRSIWQMGANNSVIKSCEIYDHTVTYRNAVAPAATDPGNGNAAHDARRHNPPWYFNNSYWFDLTTAFLHTMAVTQLAWGGDTSAGDVDSPNAGSPRWPTGANAIPGLVDGQAIIDRDVDGDGVLETPSALDTVEEVDAWFLRCLGESPDQHARGSRPDPVTGIYLHKRYSDNSDATLVPWTTNHNIKTLLAAGSVTPQQAANMELIVNDIRMSFFGSSIQYADFRPIDFDDDGNARCSAYGATTSQPADSNTGYGPSPANFFSLTGHFVFQKSRFYRVWIRGEVFDELRQLPIGRADLEAVYAVDPDGEVFDANNATIAGFTGTAPGRLLYQRWMRNLYTGYTPKLSTE